MSTTTSQTTTLSFRTDNETRDEIDKIAESLDRNRNWVINKAVANYLEHYNWELQQIDAGFKEIDEGEYLEQHEVEAMVKEMTGKNKPKKSARAKDPQLATK